MVARLPQEKNECTSYIPRAARFGEGSAVRLGFAIGQGRTTGVPEPRSGVRGCPSMLLVAMRATVVRCRL
jgi:hypothetical protein